MRTIEQNQRALLLFLFVIEGKAHCLFEELPTGDHNLEVLHLSKYWDSQEVMMKARDSNVFDRGAALSLEHEVFVLRLWHLLSDLLLDLIRKRKSLAEIDIVRMLRRRLHKQCLSKYQSMKGKQESRSFIAPSTETGSQKLERVVRRAVHPRSEAVQITIKIRRWTQQSIDQRNGGTLSCL